MEQGGWKSHLPAGVANLHNSKLQQESHQATQKILMKNEII